MKQSKFDTGIDPRGDLRTTRIKPISEVNQMATDLLIKKIGVVDTIRFLNQFRAGKGNCFKERINLFKGMSVKDIVAKIK